MEQVTIYFESHEVWSGEKRDIEITIPKKELKKTIETVFYAFEDADYSNDSFNDMYFRPIGSDRAEEMLLNGDVVCCSFMSKSGLLKLRERTSLTELERKIKTGKCKMEIVKVKEENVS